MEYLIKVSAILVLFYVCYKLFLNRETFFESIRSFLLFGLVTAFIIPLITIPKYIVIEPIIYKSAIDFANTIPQPAIIDNSINTTNILVFVYIIGVLFFLFKFLFQFGSLIALLLKSTKQRVASYIYVITKNIISPFSFFNWIVFNPNQFSETELEHIITHEKIHAKQLHSIDILLVELTSIILWFNPLVWLYKKDLRQNLEFIADKNAQATTNCKKSYQHLLLKTSVPNYQMALTNNFYNSLIKKRIVMLHKNRSKKKNQLKFLLILPALALFLMSFNTKEIYIEAESNNGEISNITESVDAMSITNVDVETLETDHKPVATTKKAITNNNIIKPNTVLKQDIVAYLIESTFTDSQLDDVINKLKAQGITLKIKNVKRNSDNEIIALKIDAKSDNSNANFSISNDSAIKTIKITYNAKSNSISIGNTSSLIHDKDYSFTHKDGTITIGKSDKSDNVFVFNSHEEHDDSDNHEIIEDDDKIIIKKGHKIHEIKKERKNKNTFTFSSDEGEVYDIIRADTVNADGNVYKFKGNVVVKGRSNIVTNGKRNVIVKGKSNGLFIDSEDDNELIEIIENEDGKSILIRKDKDGNTIKENILLNGKNNLTFKSDDNKIFKIKSSAKGSSTIWINKNDDEDKTITKIGKSGGTMFFISDNDKDPLLVIDGKVAKNKKLKDMDPDTIASISVLKGKSAKKKYGKKGKDGVVEITLKKEKD
ncbi:M56 family metallopeptidase [Pontimicrobium sp. SW4]|uniref:M56 family metallopeptidase n=1 Tax=Pontimicrobium sp. SW4 TaxID=3153519 RepID=A0AAU7BPQ7_9FLAO